MGTRRLLALVIGLCACSPDDIDHSGLSPISAPQVAAQSWSTKDGLRHSGPYYESNPGFPVHQWFATTYQEGVPGAIYHAGLEAANPAFVSFNYKSGTDTYTSRYDGTPHPDGVQLEQICLSLGIDPEAVYCHWAEDTIATLWPNTPVFYPAGSRVEVYLQGHQNVGARHFHCFAPAGRPALVEFIASRAIWDGLFLDNTGAQVFNYGDPIQSGGTVLEAGVKIGTPAFNAWHWSQIRPALAQIRARIAPKPLGINVANIWHEDYLNPVNAPKFAEMRTMGVPLTLTASPGDLAQVEWTDEYMLVADRLMQEFVGNPIRDFFPSVGEMIRRHKKAAEMGIGIVVSAAPQQGTPEVPYVDMQYGCLSLFLVMASATSFAHIQDWTGPYREDWAERVVSPAEGIASANLGEPLGDGRLAHSNPEIWVRRFEGGLVFARQRQPWNGLTSDIYWLGRPHRSVWIKPDGSLASPEAIPIYNGGGAIILTFSGGDDPQRHPPRDIPKGG